MLPNPWDLVTFTEEILNEKLHLLYSVLSFAILAYKNLKSRTNLRSKWQKSGRIKFCMHLFSQFIDF